MPEMPVPEITKVDEAFPAHALDWMPAWEEIPEEFREGDNEWEKIVHAWFFHGLPENVEFYPRKGVDAEKAYRVISATLHSFAPSHQHKVAAVAYMLSCWFMEVRNWRRR